MTSGKRAARTARWIGFTAAAQLIDVSYSAIRQAAQPGRRLAPAVNGERQIDTQHQAWKEYVENPPVERGSSAAPRTIGATENPSASPSELSAEDAAELTRMVAAITDRFGSSHTIQAWAKTRQLIAQANKEELRRDELRGLLVRRDYVQKHVIGLLDGLSRRLLADGAQSLAKRIGQAAKSGKELHECRSIANDVISAILQQAKADVVGAIRQEVAAVIEDEFAVEPEPPPPRRSPSRKKGAPRRARSERGRVAR